MSIRAKYPMLFILICLLGSCEEMPDDTYTTLSGLLVKNPFFTKMETAMIKTGLLLRYTGSEEIFTLLAPEDSAFERLENQENMDLEGFDENRLKNIVLHHSISGEWSGDAIQTAGSLSPAYGPEIRVTNLNGTTFLNGAQLLFTDVRAQNGLFHGLDKVMVYLDTNHVAALAHLNQATEGQDTAFSLIYEFIQSQGMEDLLLKNPCTLFLPTNSALRSMTGPTFEELLRMPQAQKRQFLTHYVIEQKGMFLPEISLNPINTNAGKVISVNLAGVPSQVVTINDTARAEVVLGDIQTRDGVIHLINGTLH